MVFHDIRKLDKQEAQKVTQTGKENISSPDHDHPPPLNHTVTTAHEPHTEHVANGVLYGAAQERFGEPELMQEAQRQFPALRAELDRIAPRP